MTDIWTNRCPRCGRPLDRNGKCTECDTCGKRIEVK